MNERIREFLIAENKSSAQFADEIGVQPSGISHILSGRNNPSLDFVIKMLEKYRNISSDWLLFGNGPMYKEGKTPSLFDTSGTLRSITDYKSDDIAMSDEDSGAEGSENLKTVAYDEPMIKQGKNKVLKIVWFFENKTFEEFFPGK